MPTNVDRRMTRPKISGEMWQMRKATLEACAAAPAAPVTSWQGVVAGRVAAAFVVNRELSVSGLSSVDTRGRSGVFGVRGLKVQARHAGATVDEARRHCDNHQLSEKDSN